MSILLISTCEESLHELEFVRPIEDILKNKRISFIVRHYKKVIKSDLDKFSKVIICGTSLADNDFLVDANLKKFEWLKGFEKPVLGICAGMHIIGLIFGGKINKKTEIGFYGERVEKDGFPGLFVENDGGEYCVYHLHNSQVSFSEKDWDVFVRSSDEQKIPEAVKHRLGPLYGVLFHPEVRQKQLIEEFVKNG